MKDDFYALGIVLTTILGAWNLANNYRLSRRTAFINTVTAERVKWIERLRDNLSKFCSLILTWNALGSLGAQANAEHMKEIIRLQHVIRLQLNPVGDHDKEIERLIMETCGLIDTDKSSELNNSIREIVSVSQKLLKAEWDKVKEESKRGDLKDEDSCLDRMLGKLARIMQRFDGYGALGAALV